MKKYLLLLYFLLILLTPLFSVAGDVTCIIRFHNKRIYYVGDIVEIRVELYNNSPRNFTFQTADPKYFNTTFTLRDITGRELRDRYRVTRTTLSAQPVFFRNMVIQPGEVFAFNIRLNDVLDISEAGVYFVDLEFFPNLYDNRSIRSNTLNLSIRPNLGISEVQRMIDRETGEILRRHRKPPDEVVRFTIEALQRNEFHKYFLYIDLESIMLRSRDRRDRFVRMSEADRRNFLEEFRQMLIRTMQVDHRTAPPEAIIFRPSAFEIIKTWYTQHNAEVTVMQRFRYEQLVAVKEYTYRLRNEDGIWIIFDYEVLNRGVE
ncbi:MAG: hypothetical protein FWD87_00385 [Spirochaetaceae bacterium]|nr:hypothetical protein [Spirochaetaceae bacterium]